LADAVERSGHGGYGFGIVGAVNFDKMQHGLCPLNPGKSPKSLSGLRGGSGQECTLRRIIFSLSQRRIRAGRVSTQPARIETERLSPASTPG
jgi:hypothetical protein